MSLIKLDAKSKKRFDCTLHDFVVEDERYVSSLSNLFPARASFLIAVMTSSCSVVRVGLSTAVAVEGVAINARDQYGWTPLDRAAMLGRVHCIQILLDHAADINAANKKGDALLMIP